jgi:hypothetical protein
MTREADARRRRTLGAAVLLAGTVASSSLARACADPRGNDPNVPDDEAVDASVDDAAADGDAPEPIDVVSDAGTEAEAEAGCARVLPPCPPTPPSYQQTIAPIFQERCVPCHYAGSSIAKFDFSRYTVVRANRGSVLNQIYACLMPPEDAGGLPDAGQLGNTERTEVLTWLVCGAPNN